ncbi:hypothetical protein RYH80_04205 [Halobaculum sp. MBLA0147]|uniref:hypothetical protein n=1 Tax=Halobaculum sp. MBLA0147 TaxID=3079934 RepID=UPI003523C136
MQRRGLLARLAALGVAALAGCVEAAEPTGPAGPPASPTPTPVPTSGIVVDDWDVRPGDDGNLKVPVTLVNAGERPGSRRVVIEVTLGDEETLRDERTVELASGASTSFTATFDVAFDDWAADGGVNVRLVGGDE